MILLLLGINPESWDEAQESSRAGIRQAGWLYIALSILMLLGGIQLLHGLTGSWWIGVPAGLFAGAMMSNIIRLALITVTVRIPHEGERTVSPPAAPQPSTPNAAIDGIPVKDPSGKPLTPTQQPIRGLNHQAKEIWRSISRHIHVAPLLRVIFIGLVAGAMSFPIASFFMWGTAGEILTARREKVFTEFQVRHPEYPLERIEAYRERLENEFFPIHVYAALASHPVWAFWLLVVLGLAYGPYYMLHLQHVRCAGGYFELNENRMRREILVRYASTLDKADKIIQNEFPTVSQVHLTPNIEWENPPFNTVLKKPSPEGWRTRDDWNGYLKNS